jgi:hypothetical protein
MPIVMAITALLAVLSVLPARSSVPHLGYGFNVAEWDVARIQHIGFNWMKVFEAPTSKQQLFVLLRVDANATISQSALLQDLDNKLVYKDNIDAWEIGNEVNIDAGYGWEAAPDASAYKNLLCAAYAHIKAADPDAIVVSAGLAPVGRVVGDFNGHPGNDGSKQDERRYLEELFDLGGGACLDVVGYHPYGYLADYDVAPDVVTPDVDPYTDPRSCPDGFCFRGVEKIYEIMQVRGLGDKKVWATELGWLLQRPPECDGNPSWSGRDWQMVTADKQAANLVGALQYADTYWPWMGAMFIFNLNFNTAPPWFGYDACDQMLYYSVEGRPAEEALTAMQEDPASLPGDLRANPKSAIVVIDVDWQPITVTTGVNLSNVGWQSFTYTATADLSADVVPVILNPAGIFSPTTERPLTMQIPSSGRVVGVYTGTVTVAASPGTLRTPRAIPIELRVVSELHQVFLPTVTRDAPE